MLVLKGITKRFGGAYALSDVDFDLNRGEIHVLFGENGAGKSTLINIMMGNLTPDGGTIALDGRISGALSPQAARAAGITAVFQEFSLVPDLSVEENLFLGREKSRGGFLQLGSMRQVAEDLLSRLRFNIPVSAPVSGLSRAERQMVEIAKALFTKAQVLVLDEPTASITDKDAERLFEILLELRMQGAGIIYVSHRMREIRALADRVTVLRGGRKIGTVAAADVSEATLVEMMIGRSVGAFYPRIPHRPDKIRLEVDGLYTGDAAVRGVTLNARAGEIVGIAGLVGCGKGDVARAVFGLGKIVAGSVRIDGRAVVNPTPRTMMRNGVCYFPADRNVEGLALNRPILENASIASLDLPVFTRRGWLRLTDEIKRVTNVLERLAVNPLVVEPPVESLSGGNRQKVMLARGLLRFVRVFLFDEPTVGIDVGAKAEIYGLLRDLVAAGAAVVLISSELPEVLNIANRVYVMHEGRLITELEGEKKTEANILASFFGRPAPLAES